MDSFACPHQDVCSALPAHLHFHAVASYSGLAALRALTINHHNAGIDGLQQLSLDQDAVAGLHEGLSRRGIESIVVRTCNRTEIYWRARVPGDDETVSATFADAMGVRESELRSIATCLTGESAAVHLFRVCCGLESLVLGEAEILGQIRSALAGCSGKGTFLEGVFRAALRTGRQARTETAIGEGALSVASAAIQWMSKLLPIARSQVLVIGAGDTAVKAARQLRALGAGGLVIANRTLSRAHSLARSVDGRAIGLDALASELRRVDAIVCAAATPDWLVSVSDLRSAGRPLVVADLAMPSGVEPGMVDGVTRIDLAGLEAIAQDHRAQREAEVPGVEAVIARELRWLHAWARHEAMRPLVADLRRKVEAIRRTELASAERELAQQGAGECAVLDRLSRRILDRVLSIPLAQLEAGDLPLDATHAEYLRRLFGLGVSEEHDGGRVLRPGEAGGTEVPPSMSPVEPEAVPS